MNRKKLYISDLDGTLIEDGKSLNEEIIELLNLAITDDKKELIISSARNYYSIKKKIDGLKKSIKVVSRNGSVIYDEFGKVIYAVYMSKEDVTDAINYSLDHNLCPVIIQLIDNNEKLFCNSNYINEEFKTISINMDINYIENFEEMSFENVIGIYSFGKIEKSYEYNLPNIKIRKDINFLQISSVEADKGNALKFLKNTGEYSTISSFGNDENDYLMLDYSDNAYYVYDKEENMKKEYNNIPLDNGKSIFQIMSQGR